MTNCPLTEDVDMDDDQGRLPEEIKYVKFSAICWTPDSKGFFYQVRNMVRPARHELTFITAISGCVGVFTRKRGRRCQCDDLLPSLTHYTGYIFLKQYNPLANDFIWA